ncbi:MAG: 30S ribosomal protein S12 methylthiotransferase RimO [Myxococcales bacterium]|nr:30S ribosomal protein S12 methylthiotransferase RimO [Myxococcales bacterium]
MVDDKEHTKSSGKTIHFVSLGCPKNRVDTEVMLGVADGDGYTMVADPESADVIVVNTCGFIGPAKEESIDTILEMAEHKSKSGGHKKLVVTGCLSQRYSKELAEEMPEVDHFLGSSDMLQLEKVLAGGAPKMLVGNPAAYTIRAEDRRMLSGPKHSAYVKIAEGCNRTCSFCSIPSIRGKQRSRTIEDVVDEVRHLAANGTVEVNLVSQDTIAYGRDIDGRPTLAQLVRALGEIDALHWIRLHYLYPETLTDELVDVLATHPKVVRYVDMPLQHASDPMLRSMKRGHGGDRLRRVVETVRTKVPNVVFRTAFIVGHPGETDKDFDELVEFVEWAQFDHVGVFRYSDEENVASHAMDAKVSAKVSAARHRKLMSVQRPIARKKNKARIGETIEVLVEGPSEEHEFVMQGRHAGQAPEVDGVVYLSGAEVAPGTFVKATITQSAEFDLVGEVEGGDGWLEAEEAKERREQAREAAKKAVKRKVSLRIAQ